jgi:hypothetical protein
VADATGDGKRWARAPQGQQSRKGRSRAQSQDRYIRALYALPTSGNSIVPAHRDTVRTKQLFIVQVLDAFLRLIDLVPDDTAA